MHEPHSASAAAHAAPPLDIRVNFSSLGDEGGLRLIVRDLARALNAEAALLAVAAPGDEVDVLAVWGATTDRDGMPHFPVSSDVVGRVLRYERAAVEPTYRSINGLTLAHPAIPTGHVIGAPVRPPGGPTGVLCAAFSSYPSRNLANALWLTEGYARLAALCLHDHEALDALLCAGQIDSLTGCLTQAALLDTLRREIARAQRQDLPLSCVLTDLDQFKRLNDHYGHLHGSRVLAAIGTSLRRGIRAEDSLGRYGGDKFVLILPNTDARAAGVLGERLRTKIIAATRDLPHDPIDISIGVAQWQRGAPASALLHDAGGALFQVKSSRRTVIGGDATLGV
jgi:diguanylate cyclase (GGDEF)-like protein